MGSSALILTLFILVPLSAYFSATETAFSALNRARVKNMAAGGDRRAQLVLDLSQDYDKLLSTILIGNNIVNITSASLATVLFVGWLGDAGVGVSTASGWFCAMCLLLVIGRRAMDCRHISTSYVGRGAVPAAKSGAPAPRHIPL